MKLLFTLFWQICTFRKGPQDVPHSPHLLGLLVLALLVVSIVLTQLIEPHNLRERFLGSAVALAVWFVIIYSLLSVKNFANRFLQTITACLGTDLIISLISVPLQLMLVNGTQKGMISTLVQASLLSLVIWDVAIKGRIYDSAMGLGRLGGNVLAIILWIMLLVISLSFLPVEST